MGSFRSGSSAPPNIPMPRIMPIAARLFSMKYAGAQVQNVRTADRVQFLLRRMQPRDWPGAFRNLRARSCSDAPRRAGRAPSRLFAIASLCRSWSSRELTGGNIKYAAAAPRKALVSAGRIAHVGRDRLRAFAHKALQSPPRRAPRRATFSPFNSRELAMIEPVCPLAPKITYMASSVLSVRPGLCRRQRTVRYQ